MSKKYNAGDVVDVKIQKIVPQGLGMGFLPGLTVFVSLSAVGDEVSVKLDRVSGKTGFGKIEKIINAGEDRIDPPCEYFGKCGGCDFQQMNYDAQITAKKGIILDSLKRIGRIDLANELEFITCPSGFYYRSRAQFHLDIQQKTGGYFRRGSHDIINIEHCPILTPTVEEQFLALRNNIEWQMFIDQKVTVEMASSGNSTSVYSPELIEPTIDINYVNKEDNYTYSAQTFFQGNQLMIPDLINLATEGLTGKTAFDLYCGVGLFTLPLARSFEKVIAVEDNMDATDFAEKNLHSCANVDILTDDVVELLFEYKGDTPDLILLDPPRSGMEPFAIKKLAEIGSPNISYVSCDPAILARDLRIFLDHGYSIERITGIDLFPQTHHVETVVRLKK